ncbi:MAG: 50S ribosomal protein L25, partial [Pseudomonadota bacterium]
RLKRTSKINLFIPVAFEGEDTSPGIKKGGVLTVVRPEVELIVTAGDIPESISVDVSGLQVGDTVTISSVTLPAGARPTIDRDFVIANISAPSGLRSADNAEESESEEGAEAAES